MFDPTSRYAALPTLYYSLPDGTKVPYKQPRIVPKASTIAIRSEMESRVNERADQLSARALGTAELYWKLYDANSIFDPFSLSFTWPNTWQIPNS